MKASNFLYYKNWAVIGNVSTEGKYAFKIVNSLKNSGYDVIGINPRNIAGDTHEYIKKAFSKIHVLDLCINPSKGIDIVKIANEAGVDKILVQPGAESQEILDFCNNNGIDAVCGCALAELSKRHQR
ncbi:CoA-binding protein [Clostridium sp. MT-14]|uniref:CoA-binding protein n=1 Tax=Clostridium aromativorans TaxID=2836848 RepID=A0ABS8N3Q6_9CLOT|nr:MULTISPECIES: CoA-binding protein [Clostridium]KAA8674974.1 CoA-binding protein [Clostridium sp. HV4-5-A1G]MCC9294446.1 CoA-binding protein [Clostridium aromativorans]CAB1255159.1 CoA_binding domain-containing protein [Clostridiaceae bacterium BL-3]